MIGPSHIEEGMTIRTNHPRNMWRGVNLTVTVAEHESARDPLLRRSYIEAVAPNGLEYKGFLSASDETWERVA